MDGKWQGWAAAGAILMVFVGGFKAISGFIGLFNDEWLVRGFNAYYFIDISALAWWYLIVGVILLLAGLAVMNGKAWGRWVGVVAAGVAIISELLWLPIYPVWSILLITMYVFIMIGLVAVGSEE
ncbi:MAG TPA: hypothetical protein VFZ86_14480 [Thermoleophilia bacterium]|jgi:hypothetical protein|nr:hypothetical protein [Thermoleophilia bacterium]